MLIRAVRMNFETAASLCLEEALAWLKDALEIEKEFGNWNRF